MLGNDCVRKIHLKIKLHRCFRLSFSDPRVFCNPLPFRFLHKGLARKLTKHRDLLVDDGEMDT